MKSFRLVTLAALLGICAALVPGATVMAQGDIQTGFSLSIADDFSYTEYWFDVETQPGQSVTLVVNGDISESMFYDSGYYFAFWLSIPVEDTYLSVQDPGSFTLYGENCYDDGCYTDYTMEPHQYNDLWLAPITFLLAEDAPDDHTSVAWFHFVVYDDDYELLAKTTCGVGIGESSADQSEEPTEIPIEDVGTGAGESEQPVATPIPQEEHETTSGQEPVSGDETSPGGEEVSSGVPAEGEQDTQQDLQPDTEPESGGSPVPMREDPTDILTLGPGTDWLDDVTTQAGDGEWLFEGLAFPEPDVGLILFVSDRDGDEEIYLTDIVGENNLLYQLTDNSASEHHPVWSPNRALIAFASDRDGDWEIYIMAADGSNVYQLTDNQTEDFRPVWSPDGTQLLYHVIEYEDDQVRTRMYLADLVNGGDPQQFNADVEGSMVGGVWSPDGEYIAYLAESETDTRDLFMCHLETGEITRLTFGDGAEWDFAWAPDGQSIVFNREGWDTLYSVDIRTQTVQELWHVDESGKEIREMDWSPNGQYLAYRLRDTGAETSDICLTRVTAGQFLPEDTHCVTGLDAPLAGQANNTNTGQLVLTGSTAYQPVRILNYHPDLWFPPLMGFVKMGVETWVAATDPSGLPLYSSHSGGEVIAQLMPSVNVRIVEGYVGHPYEGGSCHNEWYVQTPNGTSGWLRLDCFDTGVIPVLPTIADLPLEIGDVAVVVDPPVSPDELYGVPLLKGRSGEEIDRLMGGDIVQLIEGESGSGSDVWYVCTGSGLHGWIRLETWDLDGRNLEPSLVSLAYLELSVGGRAYIYAEEFGGFGEPVPVYVEPRSGGTPAARLYSKETVRLLERRGVGSSVWWRVTTADGRQGWLEHRTFSARWASLMPIP
ncbi:MAG: PD40 domain-containing protein [Anaerolineae bacterium]|nr:PD40 domain-containing protein [Anaerolineae bacterium]